MNGKPPETTIAEQLQRLTRGDNMRSIAISSGHGRLVPGARDIIDEVTEARRVVDRVHELLQGANVPVVKFFEETATTATANVNAIVNWHNRQLRDLDVSVHFNAVAGGTREGGIGTETMYLRGNTETRVLAETVSKRISDVSGLILRNNSNTINGAWGRANLGFLNGTRKPAILLEICFVNSRTDVRLYQQHFEEICHAIAECISGQKIEIGDDEMIFRTINDIPEGAIRRQAQRLIDEGTLVGTGETENGAAVINVTETMIRTLTMARRQTQRMISEAMRTQNYEG